LFQTLSVIMKNINQPNQVRGPGSLPKKLLPSHYRRKSREDYAADVPFLGVFRDSFVCREATRHDSQGNPQNSHIHPSRYLMGTLFVTAPLIITVILQCIGHCNHCTQSLAVHPFQKLGQMIAAYYIAGILLGLVALSLTKFKRKKTRRRSREYCKDCNT
jgi:hypothetical protein